jgi:hypothetical protein
VHPTLGILARFQAFFYASAFFPVGRRSAAAPARVTQTVSWQSQEQMQNPSLVRKFYFVVVLRNPKSLFSGGSFSSLV